MSKILKTSIILTAVAMLMLAFFTGCGEAEKAMDDMTSSNATSQTIADTTAPLNSESTENNNSNNNTNNNDNSNTVNSDGNNNGDNGTNANDIVDDMVGGNNELM